MSNKEKIEIYIFMICKSTIQICLLISKSVNVLKNSFQLIQYTRVFIYNFFIINRLLDNTSL